MSGPRYQLEIISQKLSEETLLVLTEGIVDADSPGHSLLTLNGGEYFSGVLESNRSFA